MNNFLDYVNKLQQNSSSLTELSFANDSLTKENLTILINALSENNNLKILELNNNNLSLDHIKSLANILDNNQSLESLYLRSCKIGDKGSEILAESLQNNQSLQQLYLGNNGIREEGVLAFSKTLLSNTGLEVLSFRNNMVTEKSAKSLAKSLETNAVLKTLNLANTELNDEGIKPFLYTLLLNTTLQEIKINYNNIEKPELLFRIKDSLSYNKSQNVVAINSLSKKIIRYCEAYVDLEHSGKKTNKLEKELTEKFGLNREDRYHLSTKNIHGGSTLCLALIFNIIESRYSEDGIVIMIQTAEKLCDLFSKVEKELSDPIVKKPNEKIIEIATKVISIYKEKLQS